ncbi:hypothetical protein Droror1_Dr00027910 [Drosera rotundifolia]
MMNALGFYSYIIATRKQKQLKFFFINGERKKARQKRKYRFGDSIQTSQTSNVVGGFLPNVYNEDAHHISWHEVNESVDGDQDEDEEKQLESVPFQIDKNQQSGSSTNLEVIFYYRGPRSTAPKKFMDDWSIYIEKMKTMIMNCFSHIDSLHTIDYGFKTVATSRYTQSLLSCYK